MECTFCDRCGAVIKVNVGSTAPNCGVRTHGVTFCQECGDKAQDMLAAFQREAMPDTLCGIPFKPTKLIPTVAEELAEDDDE